VFPAIKGGDPIFVPANTQYDVPWFGSFTRIFIEYMKGYLFRVSDASQEGSVGAGWYECPSRAYPMRLASDVLQL